MQKQRHSLLNGINYRIFHYLFFTLMVFCSLSSSCTKEEEEMEDPPMDSCRLNIVLNPVCSFNPTISQAVSFPVQVLIDGVALNQTGYDFSWSTDPDFAGSAISVSYEQLPLIVGVTETETGCTGSASLETDYWD